MKEIYRKDLLEEGGFRRGEEVRPNLCEYRERGMVSWIVRNKIVKIDYERESDQIFNVLHELSYINYILKYSLIYL